MKPAATPKLIYILLSLILLSVATASVQSQGNNLLVNPGFEGPYTERSDGALVAEGWQPWSLPVTANSPSYERKPTFTGAAPDVGRVRSGENAQQIFTNLYFTFNAGVYQQITGVSPGTELRFSVYALIWSSALDDREVSENPGDVIVFVGIDPTGGTDATSGNIVWSPAAPDQYDAYRQYAVIANAEADAVTVFVWAQVGFPTRNNYVYLDDAVLEVTPGSGQPPTSAPAATNTTVATDDDIGIIIPTNTSVPVATATSTVAPTNTSVPPSATSAPSATAVPSNTPIPQPTSTPEDATPTREGDQATSVPAATQTSVPQPTNTPVSTTAPEIQPSQTPLPTQEVSAEFPSSVTYKVQRGDTVSRIASLYGSSIQAIIDANGLNQNALIFVDQVLVVPVPILVVTSTPSPTPIVTPTPIAFPDSNVYVVQAGDTLYSIALRFNTTVVALAFNNGIANPNLIRVGQRLIVPGSGTGGGTPETRTYVVQPKDNVYRISLRYNVSMAAIAEANDLANINRIFVGQVLVIP